MSEAYPVERLGTADAVTAPHYRGMVFEEVPRTRECEVEETANMISIIAEVMCE